MLFTGDHMNQHYEYHTTSFLLVQKAEKECLAALLRAKESFAVLSLLAMVQNLIHWSSFLMSFKSPLHFCYQERQDVTASFVQTTNEWHQHIT